MNFKDIGTVVIQAGGKGTRMGRFTDNKPKCLVPYKGKTIIEHQLQYFKDKRIFVITDHLEDLLVVYLTKTLGLNNLTFIHANDKSTMSGIDDVCGYLSDDEPFILTWSDLIYTDDDFDFKVQDDITVITTDSVECRWSVVENQLVKKTSTSNGVVGLYVFKNKKVINGFDHKTSLVGGNLSKLPKSRIGYRKLNGIFEIGTEEIYEKIIANETSRFFNQISFANDQVVKTCLDKNYISLLRNETDWYESVTGIGIKTPRVLSKTDNSFIMTRVNGCHLFDLPISLPTKEKVVLSIVDGLTTLHNSKPAIASCNDTLTGIYLHKTIDRVKSVADVIPNFDEKYIKINNNICLNPFYDLNDVTHTLFTSFKPLINQHRFVPIHGDPTLSNILVDSDLQPWFIDPRGVFGTVKLYGDKNYDWGKLLYSLMTNYDSINNKQFQVTINGGEISLSIKSNGFEQTSNIAKEASGMDDTTIRLMLSTIWLSLCGYVKEDIDAIRYAFYQGVLLWNIN